eukprot:2804456-Prymnesium_polylepis.2
MSTGAMAEAYTPPLGGRASRVVSCAAAAAAAFGSEAASSWYRALTMIADMPTSVGTLQSRPAKNIIDICPASPVAAAEPLPPDAVARAAAEATAAQTASTALTQTSSDAERGSRVARARPSGLVKAGRRAAIITEKAPMLFGGGVTAIIRWNSSAKLTPSAAARPPRGPPRPDAA